MLGYSLSRVDLIHGSYYVSISRKHIKGYG